jgi:hypothetical protein
MWRALRYGYLTPDQERKLDAVAAASKRCEKLSKACMADRKILSGMGLIPNEDGIDSADVPFEDRPDPLA